MNHSTPVNSPIRENEETEKLLVPSVSPIHRDDDSVEERKRPILDQSSIYYMDEWVLNMTDVSSYLEYVNSDNIEDNSTYLLGSFSESHISVNDTVRTTSPIRSVDYSFFREWLEDTSICNDSTGPIIKLTSILNTFRYEQYDDGDFEKRNKERGESVIVDTARLHPDYTEDTFLQKLIDAGAQLRNKIVENQPFHTNSHPKQKRIKVEITPLRRETTWMKEYRFIKTAPRPVKTSRLSLWKKILSRR